MTSLPPSSRYLQEADQPVDDNERESLAKTLSDAYSEGRLGQDDYLEGLDAVYGASVLGDLVPVVENLPAPSAKTPAIIEQGVVAPGEVSESRSVMLPAMMITIGGVALLVVLALLVAVLILL